MSTRSKVLTTGIVLTVVVAAGAAIRALRHEK